MVVLQSSALDGSPMHGVWMRDMPQDQYIGMDQVVHEQIGWLGKQRRIQASRRLGFRILIPGALCAALAFFIVAASASAQLLMSDNFDEVGNTNGGAPAGWTLSLPTGTQASIVNSSVTTPESAPYCVELVDNSASSRPEIYQIFRSESNGVAMVPARSTATGSLLPILN